MAHLREVAFRCSRCGKPAKYELFSCRNAKFGLFCAKCGKAMLEILQSNERDITAMGYR